MDRELGQSRKQAGWIALDSWLRSAGYVPDVGTAVGGQENGRRSLLTTYRNSEQSSNAVLDHYQGNGKELFHVMIFGLNGARYDKVYDPVANRVAQKSFWAMAMSWGNCVAGVTAGSAASCAIMNAIDAEIGFTPCFAGGVLGVGAVGCAVAEAINAIGP